MQTEFCFPEPDGHRAVHDTSRRVAPRTAHLRERPVCSEVVRGAARPGGNGFSSAVVVELGLPAEGACGTEVLREGVKAHVPRIELSVDGKLLQTLVAHRSPPSLS